jgi:hypothetical protein
MSIATIGQKPVTEAAILVPSSNEMPGIPIGSAIMCPVDERGQMFSSQGALTFVYDSGVDPFSIIDFHTMTSRAALRLRNLSFPSGFMSCPPSEIQIVAIYDLTRDVLSQVLLPNVFEHWFDIDIPDLIPDQKPNGSMSLSDVHYLQTAGGRLYSSSPYIFQSWNGQVIYRESPDQRAVIYDYTSEDLKEHLVAHDIDPRLMRRLCGTTSQD